MTAEKPASVRAPRIRSWWARVVTRSEKPPVGKFVGKDGVCAGCGPWCEDHGWKVPEPTGNPEADLAAARAFHNRITTYFDGPR